MNRDPILFRVDGTPEWLGTNDALPDLRGGIAAPPAAHVFLSQLEPAFLGLNVKRAGNDWLDADAPAGSQEDLEELLQEIRRLRPAAVVVDAADAGEDYLSELTGTGTLVVSMDHLANIQFPSQLVVNPMLNPGRESYDFVSGTQLLLGPRYTLVRSEIRRLRPVRAQEPAQPFRALVALGEDDPHLKTIELARVLLNISKVERVDMAARPYHPALPALQELAAANPGRIELAIEPAEIVSRVTRCHLAITSGSGWSLELACVGVPQLLIVQNEAHWPTAQRLEEEGAATCLGWHETVSAQTIRQAVMNLLGDPLDRQAMARCGRKLIDGRGPDRLVTALEVLLHPSRQVDLSEAA